MKKEETKGKRENIGRSGKGTGVICDGESDVDEK